MRRNSIIFLTVVSVLLGFKVSAQPHKNKGIKVSCDFTSNLPELSHCTAKASICPREIFPQAAFWKSPAEEPCKNFLSVNCNGFSIYRDEFFLRYSAPKDILQGVSTEQNPIAPSVVISPASSQSSYFSHATLNLGNDAEIPGECQIQ